MKAGALNSNCTDVCIQLVQIASFNVFDLYVLLHECKVIEFLLQANLKCQQLFCL